MEPFRLTLTIYPLGALLALCAVPCLVLTAYGMNRRCLKAGTAGWFALLCVPLAFLLARLGYCLMQLDLLIDDWGMLLRVTDGGFLLWGALAGGLLAAWITGRITGQKSGGIADSAVIPALLLIIVGRVACGFLFKDTGIGLDLESWFAPEETDPALRYSLFAPENYSFFERFPFAVKNYYDEWSWAVFVPEALWAAGIILILWRMKEPRPGGRTTLFLLLYAAGQVVLEALLRGEVLHLPWLNFVRANQILCGIAIVAVWAVCLHGSGVKTWKALAALAQVIAAMGIVVAMEFAAFEKKISFLETVPADVCHLIMLAACAWIVLAILPLWKRKYRDPLSAPIPRPDPVPAPALPAWQPERALPALPAGEPARKEKKGKKDKKKKDKKGKKKKK